MRDTASGRCHAAYSACNRLAPITRHVKRGSSHSTCSLPASQPAVPPAALELVQERGVTFTPGGTNTWAFLGSGSTCSVVDLSSCAQELLSTGQRAPKAETWQCWQQRCTNSSMAACGCWMLWLALGCVGHATCSRWAVLMRLQQLCTQHLCQSTGSVATIQRICSRLLCYPHSH
jgi:hypothetical protein